MFYVVSLGHTTHTHTHIYIGGVYIFFFYQVLYWEYIFIQVYATTISNKYTYIM